MSKVKTTWKTKDVSGRRYMICQNSNPELSKYPQWGPEEGVCNEWAEVGHETTALTCWRCTQRSLTV